MIVNHPTTFQSFVNVVPNRGHCLTQPANSLFRAMTAMGLFWSHFQCLTRCLTPDHLQCDVVILRRHLQKCKHVEIMHSGLSWIIITQEINLSKLCPIDTGGGECYLHWVMKLSQNIEKGSILQPLQGQYNDTYRLSQHYYSNSVFDRKSSFEQHSGIFEVIWDLFEAIQSLWVPFEVIEVI